jgi:hypothetical protein
VLKQNLMGQIKKRPANWPAVFQSVNRCSGAAAAAFANVNGTIEIGVLGAVRRIGLGGRGGRGDAADEQRGNENELLHDYVSFILMERSTEWGYEANVMREVMRYCGAPFNSRSRARRVK